MIEKLLIANRGEIAVRIIRAVKAMGIRSVAIYSEADRTSVHALLADEAVCIGPSSASESYLNIARILAAARETGADAIHPGYGFLSERPELSAACSEAGIVFVGPSAASMHLLGSKAAAKTIAVANNVPIVPGMFDPNASPEALRQAAVKIGFPIMLKAAAGGGGRGMRVVRDADDFDNELRTAADEAVRSFGDGTMMVEKLVDSPRHIEVQVMADTYGNVACLYERECSIQRRHQKLVEEAPSPYLAQHPEMWEAMRGAAIRLVKACDYVGVGTVEFMVDTSTDDFFFLEVNTRLQVEHPVTEAITGLDLVQWQIRVAQGERLDLPDDLMSGSRSRVSGHSIEVRVIAEDPAKGFSPSIGKILAWAEPRAPGIRLDAGFQSGSEITRFYDSLLGKVIAHGENRMDAIQKLRVALLDFHILGVQTNLAYLLDVLNHPDFIAGAIDTGFLQRHFEGWEPKSLPLELGSIISYAESKPGSLNLAVSKTVGSWDATDGFRLTGRA